MEGVEKLKSLTIPFIGRIKGLYEDEKNSESIDNNKFIGYIFGANNYILNESVIPYSLENIVITKQTIIPAVHQKPTLITPKTIPVLF